MAKRKRSWQRRKENRSRRKALRRSGLSVVQKQNIRLLAEQIGRLIPWSSFGGKLTLTALAKKRGLTKFLPKKTSSKKDGIVHFLELLLVNKPRVLKKLIREILPLAVERRHNQGDPLLSQEASALSDRLFLLGVNLKKEIKEMNLPVARPRVVPPSVEIQQTLNKLPLHSLLSPECKELFLQGHINESVRKAAEKFEVRVQGLSGITDKIGRDLMANAFSEINPKIKLNSLTTTNEKNEQEGFKFIAMGIMIWWRNTTSHGDEPQMAPLDGLSRLLLISNLLHILDERTKVA